MNDSLKRMEDAVFEGRILRIDFEERQGVIEMSTSSDNETPLNSIQFPLSELRVPEQDRKFIGPDFTFKFKLCDEDSTPKVTHACEVTPADESLFCAQIYNIGENFFRVLLNESKRLANVNLDTLKRVFPHHMGLHIMDCCIVSLSWTEFLQANREKRLPVVHLVEVHESMEEALASLKLKTVSKPIFPTLTKARKESVDKEQQTEASNVEIQDSIEQSKAQPVLQPESYTSRVKHKLRRIIRQRSPSPQGAPLSSTQREQIERAYWFGVRDGASSHYQQIMSPAHYSPLNSCCSHFPMHFNPLYFVVRLS